MTFGNSFIHPIHLLHRESNCKKLIKSNAKILFLIVRMDTIVSRMAFVTSLGTVLENLVTNKGVEIVTLKKMAMDETEMAVVGMDTCVEMEEKVGWEV